VLSPIPSLSWFSVKFVFTCLWLIGSITTCFPCVSIIEEYKGRSVAIVLMMVMIVVEIGNWFDGLRRAGFETGVMCTRTK